MARKRYGRNQRRQHREEIAQLTLELTKARAHAEELQRLWDRALANEATARAVAEQAENEAFQRFMDAGRLMRITLEKMASVMGQKLGDELLPAAEAILRAPSVVPRRPPSFTVRVSRVPRVRFIEGQIPAIAYCVAVTDEEMMLGR